MKKAICIIVALSLLVATMNIGAISPENSKLCMKTQLIMEVMTTSTTASAVHNHTPNNHNLQESAVTIEKMHEIENPADYMDGLTAYSKRTIYVGDAERRFYEKNNC